MRRLNHRKNSNKKIPATMKTRGQGGQITGQKFYGTVKKGTVADMLSGYKPPPGFKR